MVPSSPSTDTPRSAAYAGDPGRHGHVLLEGRVGDAVLGQAAVDHHAGEAGLDGPDTVVIAGAVVQVQHHRHVGVAGDRGLHRRPEQLVRAVGRGADDGLDDHRGVGLPGGIQHRFHLDQVGDVEGADAVRAVLRRVQGRTQGDQCHASSFVSGSPAMTEGQGSDHRCLTTVDRLGTALLVCQGRPVSDGRSRLEEDTVRQTRPTLLGLDLGTSAMKATVLDADGATCVSRSVPTPFRTGPDGFTEMSVPDLFGAVQDLLLTLGPWLPAVAGLGIASLGESGGWVQGDQIADVPILVWHDPRGRSTSDRLIEVFGQAELVRRTGRRSRSDLTVSKLGWLAEQGIRPAGTWTGVAGLLVWHLTGRLAQEPSLAATSGVYDPYSGRYHTEILAEVGLTVDWADVIPAGTRLGTVTRQRAAETGLPAGIPVTIAGHDHPVGVLGAGGRPGMVVDSMGTGEPLVAAWSNSTAPYPDLPYTELPIVGGDLTVTCWPGDDALMILWEHLRPGSGCGTWPICSTSAAMSSSGRRSTSPGAGRCRLRCWSGWSSAGCDVRTSSPLAVMATSRWTALGSGRTPSTGTPRRRPSVRPDCAS